MRLRAVCAPILIAAAVIAPHAFGQDALDAIDGCIKRLDPQGGYERIAERCPDLMRRVQRSAWAAWLPENWYAQSNDLSAASLKELRQLVVHELSLRTSSRAPDRAKLNAILLALGPMEPQSISLWTRFTGWLREALQRGEPSPEDNWLDRMIARAGPSQTVIDSIAYACLAVVVGMALALIVNELRLAGAFAHGGEQAGAGRRAWPIDKGRTSPTSEWSAIQSAPARERPRLLLERISARLMELGRLPPAGGLTVRELLGRARLVQSEDLFALAELALAAERVRFSGEPIPAASLEAVVEGGRRLLQQLSA